MVAKHLHKYCYLNLSNTLLGIPPKCVRQMREIVNVLSLFALMFILSGCSSIQKEATFASTSTRYTEATVYINNMGLKAYINNTYPRLIFIQKLQKTATGYSNFGAPYVLPPIPQVVATYGNIPSVQIHFTTFDGPRPNWHIRPNVLLTVKVLTRPPQSLNSTGSYGLSYILWSPKGLDATNCGDFSETWNYNISGDTSLISTAYSDVLAAQMPNIPSKILIVAAAAFNGIPLEWEGISSPDSTDHSGMKWTRL